MYRSCFFFFVFHVLLCPVKFVSDTYWANFLIYKPNLSRSTLISGSKRESEKKNNPAEEGISAGES